MYGELPEDLMDDSDFQIREIQKKWNEIRHWDREEAEEKLKDEPEWLAAYNRFYAKYEYDRIRLQEIADVLYEEEEKLSRFPKKKSKKQKRRDRWAKILEERAAEEAHKNRPKKPKYDPFRNTLPRKKAAALAARAQAAKDEAELLAAALEEDKTYGDDEILEPRTTVIATTQKKE